MNSAERFYRHMTYQSVDHVPDMEFGYWDECFVEWPEQGMPRIEASHRTFELYFGFEQAHNVPMGCGLQPAAEFKRLKIEGDYEYYLDGEMVTCRRPADGHSAMPEHLDYTLKDDASWEEHFLWRLNPDSPERFYPQVAEYVDQILAGNEIPQLHVGSMFGRPRNWIGFEQICMMVYTNPDLVERILDQICLVTCTMLEKVMPLVAGKVKWAHFWEDICSNHGPMISPDYFRAVVGPRIKRVTDILKRHGVEIISVDCDGKVEPLVEPWMEAGVNTMFPLEQNGGSDPVAFRKRWGRDLRLMGGVDKVKMAEGGDVIRRELERLAPLVAEGGFIPFCDHRVPPNVSLANYRHYLRCKREIFGIPAKLEQARANALDIA